MTLRIGTLELATNVALSPLAGYADYPFRRSVRPLGGLGLATTELVSPRGLLRDAGRTRTIAHVAPDDAPLAVQLYGVEPDVMAEAARWAADHGAAAIDINMGRSPATAPVPPCSSARTRRLRSASASSMPSPSP
jgi:tRNA-dihydrouridine synthase